ncbi:hypothetical protein BC830DRAFT_1166316 [Chytriomyces sp. MP71]|nr:hypothetical protein BC830DRAFT_1166316 [Chytriomyces sp. MP71]
MDTCLRTAATLLESLALYLALPRDGAHLSRLLRLLTLLTLALMHRIGGCAASTVFNLVVVLVQPSHEQNHVPPISDSCSLARNTKKMVKYRKSDPYGVIDFLDEAPESSRFHRSAPLHNPHMQDRRPAHLHIPAQVPSLMPPVRQNSFDNGASFDDSFSPLSSPTRDSLSPSSVPSSRHNSVDMGIESSYGNEPLSPLLGSSSLLGQAPLQATGGGTAALTPALAVELTKAQVKLSQLKKQKDSIPPIGYICRLCAIEGHWMENCILYKSNKHPQYNNAARAVALNIISPGSQVVLNSLPVVAQPAVHYTPKFVAAMHQQQLQQQEKLVREQQYIQQQRQLYAQQQQLCLQQQQQREQQHLMLQREQHYQYRQQLFRNSSPGSPVLGSFFLNPPQFPREPAGMLGTSRFEQIWMN